MLWFLKGSHLQAESCTLITAVANSAVFLTHTRNSSTPGSQHTVLAIVSWLLCDWAHGGKWAELSFAGFIAPTPGWPAPYSPLYGGENQEPHRWAAYTAGLSIIWEALSAQLSWKEHQEGESSSSFKGQTTYGSARGWQSHGAWKLGYVSAQSYDLWKLHVTLLSPKPVPKKSA
jgi:hypothetical protein